MLAPCGAVRAAACAAPDGGGGAVVYTGGAFSNSAFEQQSFTISIPALGAMNVLRLPSGVQRIEEEAFLGLGCEAVIIPASCTEIGSRAFSGCAQLRYVRIPAGTSVADDAFAGCPKVILDRGN